MAAESQNLLSNIRIVLCRPSHPGNIGAAARAMKTMGLSQLVLVNPKKFPHAEAEAMASGAVDVLESARVCESLEEALSGCALAIGTSTRQRDLLTALLTPAKAASQALMETQSGTVAFVFGNETFGLSREELARCPALVERPSQGLRFLISLIAHRRDSVCGQDSRPTPPTAPPGENANT